MRDKNSLEAMDKYLNGKISSAAIQNLHQIAENCLIPVSLLMNDRGIANKFSIICLPKKSDLKRNANKLKQFDHSPVYVEPIGRDGNQEKRKHLRMTHLKLLKRLRRRRVRVKRKNQEYSERKVIIAPPQTAKLIAEQLQKMCEFWLPSTPKQIRHQCSREVFGYLTQSQFSFIEAKVGGIGYVTMNGLHKLVKLKNGQKSNNVLIRDPNSLNYRMATVSIRSV